MTRAALLALLVAGCSGADPVETGPAAPGETAAPAVDTGLCATAPVTTWDNFGKGFLKEECQSCHASTTTDRHGAPEDVIFDTEDDAWAVADRILARATGEEPTMPPASGVSEDDRYLLEVWLSCDSP